MADATKLAVKSEPKATTPAPSTVRPTPFESLRNEVDRVFDAFNLGAWRLPFSRHGLELEMPWSRSGSWDLTPAVDVAEKPTNYEITAELPGMDEKDIEVKLSNGTLTIKGEKKEETEQRHKDYYVSERRYGSFQRSFPVPEGVDAAHIEASFAKGVLKVTLPKTADAQRNDKKIAIKAA
ncbi:Hsp20/alpha crystallin family protein [Chelatococcus asaccharovorans]|uniref:Heat shock protein Hsp20 n=1 Tax=Chelatococcus asaccharovorans TaxID=28210 RepID=A0A2V3TVZ8_9HYPH|nr:Hsp20/alpha crystallin family protein [Chelatococcus asaccharovorans]MBS7706069.1 Hsp20/alpha crystallin family protein [Chelatococcus asaccharovorans]PXW52438.1 heat shock protein Hsp20 [Chelatococcus asaccharovorans]